MSEVHFLKINRNLNFHFIKKNKRRLSQRLISRAAILSPVSHWDAVWHRAPRNKRTGASAARLVMNIQAKCGLKCPFHPSLLCFCGKETCVKWNFVICYELVHQDGNRSRRLTPLPFDPLTNLSANREEFPARAQQHQHTPPTAGRGRGGLLFAREHARHVETEAGSTCCQLQAGWH